MQLPAFAIDFGPTREVCSSLGTPSPHEVDKRSEAADVCSPFAEQPASGGRAVLRHPHR